MSKSIVLTDLGGYPLTQSDVDYLQTAFNELFAAIGKSMGFVNNTVPYIVCGCKVTKTYVGGTTYNYSVSAGWANYQGNFIRVPAISFAGIDESVNAMYMLITLSAAPTSIPFYNATTPNVICDSTISLMAQAIGTADDATHFLLSELVPYGVALGLNNRDSAWQNMVVNTATGSGGVTGTIKYKKDYIANTIRLTSSLTVNDPFNLTASPAVSRYLLGTLPAGYYSTTVIYFTAEANVIDGTPNFMQDDLGTGYIKHINMYIDAGGNVYALLVKPAVGTLVYGFEFSAVLPLD